MINIFEKIKLGLIFFILIFYFFFNIYQLNSQHWSSLMDHDFYILYNSLLVSSGLEQEGRDHPAFTTFFLYSAIFNLIDLFQNSYLSDLDRILSSSNIDESIQFYFHVSRIANFFINFLLLISFYYLLKNLDIKKEIIYFVLIIFIISSWYSLSFYSLRSENLSLLFINLSLIFILNKKNFVINCFLAGIFFGIAMFTKIQILFFILYIALFILISDNSYNKNIKENFLNSKVLRYYFIVSLIFIFISYFIFQLIIQEFPRFERNKYLDLLVFSSSFIIFIIFILSKYKLNSELKEKKLIQFSSFFNGLSFLFIAFVFLDLLKILNINDFIYLRVTNPLHYMSEFPAIFAEGSVNFKFIIQMIIKISTSYSQNLDELLIILLILFYSLRNNYYSGKSYVFYLLTLFLIFILITSINGIRGGAQYHIYYTFCYLVVIASCLNKFDYKISNIFLTFVAIIFFYNNSFIKQFNDPKNKLNIFDRQNSVIEICKEFKHGTPSKRYDATVDYIKYWHQKFDNKTINSLCMELKL